MATAQTTIDLIFNGIDKTGSATLSALNNAKSFSSSLQSATQPIADFTAGAVKLEAGLLAAGTAMTVFAVKLAGDFDGAFRELSTIINASDGDLEGFKNAIDEYAKDSSQSLAQIMGALSGAIGSGVDWAQSLDLISVAEKLAVATRSDLDSTTKVLVSTLKTYGLGIEDAGDLSDLFFSIIDKGDIRMSDLAASFAKVAPVAQIAGVSLEEIGAAIATLTASGIKPAESIEYLRGAINNIIAPSGQAKDLAAELGLNFSAAGLKADGLAGLLGKVSAATGNSADKMKILFGDTGGFVAAVTLAGPQSERFAQILVEMADRAGKTGAAFAIMKVSLENSTKAVTNSFEYMMRQIGTPLLDEFGGIARAISEVFKALGVSLKEGGLKDLVTYIDGLMDDLQKTIETVAKNLPAALAKADFSGFKNGIDVVIGAFGKLFAGIDITTVEGLTRAIELAGAAFLSLSEFTVGVVQSFKPLFDKLVEVASKLSDLGPDFFEVAGNIGGVVTQMNMLLGAVNGLLPWLETLVGLMVAKQGLSLVGAVATLTRSLPAMTTQLQQAGLAMSAYFASERVVALVMALVEWKKANDRLAESQQQSAAIQDRAGLSLERFAQTTGMVVKSVDDASKLIDDGIVIWDKATGGWVKASDALGEMAQAANSVQADFRKSEISFQNQTEAADKAATATGKLAGAQKDVSKYALATVPIYDALTGAITGYEQQLVKSATGTLDLGKASSSAATSLDAAAKATENAQAAQEKWNQEVAKMAFEEKLKLIDSATQITTARLEAMSKVAVASFESISTSITSTGDVLKTLFTDLDFSKLDWASQRAIEKQIDLENKRRDEALRLQKELTEAQIAQMRAQTDAMLRGDGLIKISGDGLEPHLEAFMWQILKNIQTRVNADGLKLLLGV